MMKFPAILLTLLVCLTMLPVTAFAAEGETPIKLYLNEKLLAPEVAPRIVDGNTLVPVRIIAESLGAKVSWDGVKRAVTVVKGDTNIQLTIDKKEATIRGARRTLEVAPVIVDGNTMLPLRFIGEQFGVKFNWDALTHSVHMFRLEETASTTRPEATPTPSGNPGQELEEDEVDPQPTPRVTATPKPSLKPTATPTLTPTPTLRPTPTPVIIKQGDQTVFTPTPTPTPTPKGTLAPVGSILPGVTPTPKPTPDGLIHVVTSIQLTDKQLIVKVKDGELLPQPLKLTNPSRIVFDLPYTNLDDSLKMLMKNNNGELPSQHPYVEKVRFSNFSDNPATVRIILDMKQPADYRIEQAKEPHQLVVSLVQHRLRVVIDAGHGAKDPGALSVTGKHEKEFTLAMAKKVSALLAQDPRVEVLMTRSDDTFIELDDRVAFANENQADLFLSIHGNKYKPETAGVETYYDRPESLDFANLIHRNTVQATGFPDRKVRTADYRVIKYTTMPAVLVEVGYLSNVEEEKLMYTESFQNQVAASLVSAIKEYLNLK
ncbi:N-acetylmuramoyl-L-alanine amidase [Paenibacillus athensensis]|uniref:MurNAc-LAA domain-containing protein n=1 Tax=Paenibacillus athensensis TaxID=1967502 RepID=A0A4Y8Q9E9_9BACL|nr:N-acetylmuramoyl-L-alanine amidase family protein [Paenibacillus athensensis]MCD1260296.1 N-acetylmuramoyl-L-alanine amidase [Paenibacillus athensensis]